MGITTLVCLVFYFMSLVNSILSLIDSLIFKFITILREYSNIMFKVHLVLIVVL